MNKDILLIILSKVDDLTSIYEINKYFYKLCNDEILSRMKLWKEYAKIYPETGQTWKNIYMKLDYYLKNYNYLKNNESFQRACKHNHLEVVKFLSISSNVKPDSSDNYAAIVASQNGHLVLVKYLSSLINIDFSDCNNMAIRLASQNGHLDVVKFLSSLTNVNAHDENNAAIRWASRNGHLNVVKYLSTLPGVDASDCYNSAIRFASEKGYLEVVKFLSTLPKVVCDDWTIESAKLNGHTKVVEYLLKKQK